MDDWRITNQKSYLKDKTLIHTEDILIMKSDHEHCAFCFDKFGEYPDCLQKGYCTEDLYYWICEECFEDFKEQFNWTVL